MLDIRGYRAGLPARPGSPGRLLSRALALACALTAVGCATPMTQVGSVTHEQIENEQLKQAQLAISYGEEQQLHLDEVAASLLRAAVPLCPDAVTTRAGFRFANTSAFKAEYVNASRALGFTDTLQVTGVVPGSPADRAGLKSGDRIVAINGGRLPLGESGVQKALDQLTNTDTHVLLTTHDSAGARDLVVAKDSVCNYNVIFVRDQVLNAFSDGHNVYVNSGIIRFTTNDDELATILGHEIAHNAMHHVDAQKQNVALGFLFGAVLDIVAMKAGVNTQGEFANDFAKYGSMVFSQDFEREADYVGLNLVAAAGRSTASSPNFWRRMAQEDPKSIMFATTHPTTAERFVRLDQLQGEIGRKLATGTPLRLALKNGTESQPLLMAHASTDHPRTVVATTAAANPPSPNAAKPLAKQQGSPAAITSLVDGGTRDTPRDPVRKSDPPPPKPAPKPPSILPQSNDRVAVAVVGAPSSDSARVAAITVFKRGQIYMDRHEWDKAESSFHEALLLDGSQAPYHAAFGDIEMVLAKWEEAEAEYTAAMLLDVMNQDYRVKVLEARRRKTQP